MSNRTIALAPHGASPALDDLAAVLPRMAARIVVTDDGCWNWTGAQRGRGYGVLQHDGTPRSTHRITYTVLVGPIPDGLVIDHLCANKICCNPAHLEAVSIGVNTLRSVPAPRAYCDRGHEMTPDNVYRRPRGHVGHVECRACRVMVKRAWEDRRAIERGEHAAGGDHA